MSNTLVTWLAAQNPEEWPSLELLQHIDDSALLKLAVTDTIRWFQGHFEQQPVLPGVAQIHWAVALSRQLFAPCQRYTGMDAVKFKKMILPATEVELQLQYVAAKAQVKFCYRAEGVECSSGTLRF